MSDRREISRRAFITGKVRSGKASGSVPGVSSAVERDFTAPEIAPDTAERRERALRKVLESMNDLSGIEEP